MARNQGILEEGRERFEGALKEMERDFKRLTKRADQGRKQFERRAQREVKKLQTELRKNPIVKRAEAQRKQLERRARKFQTELRKSPAVKRAESFRKDAETLFEEQLEAVLGALRLATASEVTRLERKVDQLNRRIRELEKHEKRPRAAA